MKKHLLLAPLIPVVYTRIRRGDGGLYPQPMALYSVEELCGLPKPAIDPRVAINLDAFSTLLHKATVLTDSCLRVATFCLKYHSSN